MAISDSWGGATLVSIDFFFGRRMGMINDT
jgi:hypothetical protein